MELTIHAPIAFIFFVSAFDLIIFYLIGSVPMKHHKFVAKFKKLTADA